MTGTSPFRGVRSVVRILVGLGILYTALWLIRIIMGVGPNLLLKYLDASPNVRAYLGRTLNYGVGIAAYLLLPAMALRAGLRLGTPKAFFPFNHGWWKDLLFGFAAEGLVLFLLFLFEVAAGWLSVESWTWNTIAADELARTIWVGLLINIGVAIGEETVFRGYLLTGLKDAIGKWEGLGLMMIIFGLFHLPAYLAAGLQSEGLGLAIMLATLLGGLFGWIYLRTDSLWLPVSLHFTWNFVENDLLNLSASSGNPNLVGAATSLQYPLNSAQLGLGGVMMLELLAAAVIAVIIWLWLRGRQARIPSSESVQPFSGQETI